MYRPSTGIYNSVCIQWKYVVDWYIQFSMSIMEIGGRLVYTIQYAYNGNSPSTAIQFIMRIMEIGGRLVYIIQYAYNGNRRSTGIYNSVGA